MDREEILQIAKPILFNTNMVRAILDDRKTETRRKIDIDIINYCDMEVGGTLLHYQNKYGDFIDPVKLFRYQKNDYLYVRETWANLNTREYPCYYYRASDTLPEWALGLWHPSIHMPKEAARIFLRVTDVRVERLQDIGDCTKEGIAPGTHATAHMNDYDERCDFAALWDSTIPQKDINKYGWKANPLVWVIQFERVEV